MAPAQVLCDPRVWSVVDLDDTHVADRSPRSPGVRRPAHRLGLPAERGPARAAYREAYAAHPGRPIDQPRFRWFLTKVERCRPAPRLTKARAAPGEAQQGVLDRLATAQL
jgi:hypothetical protein